MTSRLVLFSSRVCRRVAATPARSRQPVRALATAPGDRRQSDRHTSRKPPALTALRLVLERVNTYKTRLARSPYARLMRLDKPIGTHLLFLPAAWSITLAATPPQALALFPLFYLGAVVMRGAGCTINDICDADLDRTVERTRNRPIPAGQVSTPAAFVFLAAQGGVALVCLSQLNTPSFLVATLSVIPVLCYPLAKRRLPYPQAVLGLTINWGALLGYSAATATLAPPAFFLYAAGFCWTIVYDTIYAHQDAVYDRKAGVYSTALSFAHNTKPILAALTAAKLLLLSAAGLSADLSIPYYIGATASTLHLAHQVYATDLKDPSQCHAAFVSNSTTGAITWLAILLGRIL